MSFNDTYREIRRRDSWRTVGSAAVAFAALTQTVACGGGADSRATKVNGEEGKAVSLLHQRHLVCDADNGGITLPPGFCAIVVAENVGRARQLVVRRNGDIYVAVNPAKDGSDPGRLLALRDLDGDGRADVVRTIDPEGGNGIALDASETQLYFAHNDRIVRYSLTPSRLRPVDPPATIVSGLPAVGDHTSKTLVLDGSGGFFLNIGSATNACQVENRVPFSPGIDPCAELAERAGIWKFDASIENQTHADGIRFATGTRNMVALDLEPNSHDLWGVQNGRDQLFDNWPDRFTEEDDREAPAEEMLRISQDHDNGWPYCYEDSRLGYKVLAPEYGGDGVMQGRCAGIPSAALTFPAHWAPLSLQFYTGSQFPADYRGDAFVAVHGARFPTTTEGPGYNVMRVRFVGGQPVSREVFADGFSGGAVDLPADATHRPVGVTQGPDGSLYITSDQNTGRIWRVVYQGP